MVQGNVLPSNLELSVSNDRDKDAVRKSAYISLKSVYCTTVTLLCGL